MCSTFFYTFLLPVDASSLTLFMSLPSSLSPVALWSSPGQASLTCHVLIASIHSVVQCGTGDSGVLGMLTSECPCSCRQSASCSLRWLETKLDFRKSVLSSYLTSDSWTEISLFLGSNSNSTFLKIVFVENDFIETILKLKQSCNKCDYIKKRVKLFIPLASWKTANFGCSLGSKAGW